MAIDNPANEEISKVFELVGKKSLLTAKETWKRRAF